MRKDRFYIAVAIFMVIVVAVFITLSILGRQKRDDAVRELQSKVAEIKKRADHQRTEGAISSNKSIASIPDEENITSHKQPAEKVKALETSEVWKQLVESLVKIDDGEDTAEDHQRIAALLDENRGLLEEIRRIAGTNYNYSDESLSLLIRYARLLATNMMSSATRGDYETFSLDLEAVKAFASIARKDTALMSQLVSNAVYSILYKCIDENVAVEYLSPDQVNQLIITAASATDRRRIADVLLFESAEYIELFNVYRKIGKDTSPAQLFYATIGRPFLDMDEEFYADTMNQADTAMRLPFYESKPQTS